MIQDIWNSASAAGRSNRPSGRAALQPRSGVGGGADPVQFGQGLARQSQGGGGDGLKSVETPAGASAIDRLARV
jgi:hypothetical protein